MTNYFSTNFTLGILGGGQLGKMLLNETRKYDINTHVLDPAADAPCRVGCNKFVQGSLKDFDSVYNFGKNVHVLTIEIEHVNVEALEKLAAEGVEVHPTPGLLRIIQNKTRQKEFYKNNGIPTSDYVACQSKSEVMAAIESGRWQLPVVWKSAEGGYDGFGVSILKTTEDVDHLPDQPCLLEAFVPFLKELSVIVARNQAGETAAYPVVEMEFHPTANQVEYVLCPANINESTAATATEIALKTAKDLNLTGLLAVEMFLTHSGEILVNEVAPRTHNSGHLTIENNYTSQFEQHLRAVCNMPLGSTHIKTPAVMANLVGAAGQSGPVVYKGYRDLMHMPGINIHIYGKKETRPFRKMGHVTAIAQNLADARAMAEKAKDAIEVVAE